MSLGDINQIFNKRNKEIYLFAAASFKTNESLNLYAAIKRNQRVSVFSSCKLRPQSSNPLHSAATTAKVSSIPYEYCYLLPFSCTRNKKVKATANK